MEKTILVTIHGSHLYGLNHSESDVDFFRVVESKRRPTHRISGGFDVVTFGLKDFMLNVSSGSHQSCEALFSPKSYIDPMYRPLFEGIRVTGEDVFNKYRRTIKKFSYGDDKRRRHAVRLGFNLAELRRTGRFNPELTNDQRTKCIVLSQLYWGQSLTDIAINL